MKPLAGLVIVISFLIASDNVWSQDNQNHWDQYEPRTLQSTIDTHQEFGKKLKSNKKAMLLTGNNFPPKVRLTYLVDSRPLSAGEKTPG